MEAIQLWQSLLKSATFLTNVKIVTKDGKEKLTHKMFLVSISLNYRSILMDHGGDEDIVIIAAEDTLEDVEIELEQLLSSSMSLCDYSIRIIDEIKNDENTIDINSHIRTREV